MVKNKKYTTSIRSPRNYKTLLLIILPASAICLAAVYFIGSSRFLANTQSNPEQTESLAPISKTNNVNMSPPTNAEKDEASSRKNEIVENSANKASTGTVTPIIVDAGVYSNQVEVSAFIPNIIESNGQCTVSFTNGNLKIVKKIDASPDATTTRCSNFIFPVNELTSKGNWQVVVSYASEKNKGNSEVKILEVK